jgi:hypothetical protein
LIAGWRTRTFAFVAVALLVGACTATNTATAPLPTISAVLTPEAVACQNESVGALKPVVAIGTGASGAMLLSAPVASEPALLYLDACRWERTAAGILVTDDVGGTVLASAPPIISIERAETTGIEPTEHVLGGRSVPAVATVRVTLSDGSVQNAVVSGGYWLAWWGSQGSASVTALDASGASLADTPFTAESR